MEKRLLDINPELKINTYECFFLPETSSTFDFSSYDYIVDAVDNVTAKIEIIRLSKENGKPVISSMGTGNKLHPEMFRIADIKKTSVCPLCRVMRKELRDRNIPDLPVLFSEEEPIKNNPVVNTAFMLTNMCFGTAIFTFQTRCMYFGLFWFLLLLLLELNILYMKLQSLFLNHAEYGDIVVKKSYDSNVDVSYPLIIIQELENSDNDRYYDLQEHIINVGYQFTILAEQSSEHDAE